MDEQIWLAEERRQADWDRSLSRRPRCADCGEPIAGEHCLPLGQGEYLCLGCVRFRMTETEGVT